MTDRCPTVSVVVPLYNTERYIAQTLDSILAQTFHDFEIVVVNDASTDNGPLIVETYARLDDRVRMVTQENRGLAGARNSGIRASHGRFIALLDADDLWSSRKLALHVAHLEANPNVGVSYDPSIFIDEFGAELGIRQNPKLTDAGVDHIFCRNPVGNGSAAVIRREALDEIEFGIPTPEGKRACWFDESFRQSEDIELWTRIASTTRWVFQGIPQASTYYRVNTAGLSADVTKQLASWKRFRDKVASYSPLLVKRMGKRSEAYQYRYLARRAAMNGQGATALRLTLMSLWRFPRIAFEEPKRTVQTFAFSATAATLPAPAFEHLKNFLFSPHESPRTLQPGRTQ